MQKRPLVVWLAFAVSMAAVLWGATQLLQLARYGLVSVLEALATALVAFAAIVGVWAMRWWGFGLCGVLVAYVLAFSSYASGYSASAVAAFYIPMVLVMILQHRQFRW